MNALHASCFWNIELSNLVQLNVAIGLHKPIKIIPRGFCAWFFSNHNSHWFSKGGRNLQMAPGDPICFVFFHADFRFVVFVFFFLFQRIHRLTCFFQLSIMPHEVCVYR